MNEQEMLEKVKEDFREWKIKDFENGLRYFTNVKSSSKLKKLLSLFKDYPDEYPDLDVMYNIVHAVETYPIHIYVRTLIEEIHHLLTQSTFWTKCLFNRVFNDEKCDKAFEQNMHLAKKEDLLKLFDLMEKESPHHKELIERLRKKL